MPTIEDIILQKDTRHMTALRPHLPANYVTEAAELVVQNPGKVLITTGFYILSADAPETDGPPGAVAIGNALAEIGFGVKYVTDRYSAKVLRAIADPSHEVIEFPVASHRESADFANRVIHDELPTLLISIERCGLTGDGRALNMRGLDISEHNAKIDHLFDQFPLSIGIGDGGNEIGMGNLKAVIESTPGLPDKPCITTTRKLIAAAVSNWGGYGLVAALSLLEGRNLLPSVTQEQEWIRAIVKAGAVEGISGESKPSVDGFPLEENAVCLRDLHALLGAHNL